MKAFLIALALLGSACAVAEVVQPGRDDEVIERLPPAPPRAAPSSLDPAQEALELVAAARDSGDPRLAGQALALLKRRRSDANASAAIVVALAQAEQYLHEFDTARQRLQGLVEREPGHAQAWLMLATLHRVQGRYAASDAACAGLARSGAGLHAAACRAENDALRGDHGESRRRLLASLAMWPDAATAAWVWTTVAELEVRAGRPEAAEEAFRAALHARSDTYTAIAYADFLIALGRPRDARSALQGQPRSDAVLLRIALANPTDAEGEAAVTELRSRFAQADMRPGAASSHARERALFALHVELDAKAALRLAGVNLSSQREPIDLLLFARAARAAGDLDALAHARRLMKEAGLEDRRFDALW
jgi:predicted Zn-dependent protease